MDRRADLNCFYEILGDLRERLGGCRCLSACTGKSGWPERGVYFFFEDGEVREDGITPRVVRVGTHAVSENSNTKLWTRLRSHRGNRNGGGNHRGSIFRSRVGEALLQRAQFPDNIRQSWSQGMNAPKDIRIAETPLELAVSEYICQMPFLWVAIDDAPSSKSMRAQLETNCIALLSNIGKQPIDPPSSNWLGNCSPEHTIRDSGLWNTRHVDDQYAPDFLDGFREFVSMHSVEFLS